MSDIKEAIKNLVKDDNEMYSIVARVISVDENQRTVDVEPINGDATIFGVRLQASVEHERGLVVFPVLNSMVVATFLNQKTAFVSLASDVKSVSLKTDKDLAVELNDMFDQVSALIGILKEFQLTTNSGPTINVMPHIITKLENIGSKFQTIKDNLNTIFN